MCRECKQSRAWCEPPEEPDPMPLAVRIMLGAFLASLACYGFLFARLLLSMP